MYRPSSIILCALSLAAPAWALTPISDDFSVNTAANYTTPVGRTAFTYDGVSAGIGGVAGRVNVPFQTGGTDGNATFDHTTSIGNFGTDTTFTLSYYFLTGVIGTGTGNLTLAAIGLGDTPSNLLANPGGAAALHVDLRRNSSSPATGSQYALRFKSDDGTLTPLSATYATLTANTWYQLTLQVDLTAVNQYLLTASLKNWGADGLTGGATLITHSLSVSNTNFAPTDLLYAGFFGRNSGSSDSRVVAADNFIVIPEPASVWLALGAMVGLALRRRRW
jgi:hypothetical protein